MIRWRIPSLRACLLVAADRHAIETWTRGKDGESWGRALVVSGQRAEIAALTASLVVDAVYAAAEEPS